MINKILIITLIIYSSSAYDLRGSNQSTESDEVDVNDPYVISSNFTADVYTEDRKAYCVFYSHNGVEDGYDYPDIKFKFPYFMHRDRIKGEDCVKFNIYHPFIVYNKKCYIAAEYEYQNKTFVHKIHFKIHENNILCFTLTTICSIIAQPTCLALIYYYRCKDERDRDNLKCCEYFWPCQFIGLILIIIEFDLVVGGGLIVLAFLIYPYSFIGIAIVGSGFCTICFFSSTNKRYERKNYANLQIAFRWEDYKTIYFVTLDKEEYDLLDKDNGTVKIDYSKIAKYGHDRITFTGYSYKDFEIDDSDMMKTFWFICCVICGAIFIIIFFAYSVLRNNIIKSSRGVLLALEYHTMIVACYTTILIICALVYSIRQNYIYCQSKNIRILPF